MKNIFEKNELFWERLDNIYESCKMIIDRQRNSCHYKYSNLVYPVDYGYLIDSSGNEHTPIDIYKGSEHDKGVQAIVISADILKKDCEVKLIVGCSDDELNDIYTFTNQTQLQKSIILNRS